MSNKEELIIAALANSNDIWAKLKKGWYTNKFPGSAFSPGEFLARLIIGHFGLTEEDVIQAVTESGRLPLEQLKKEKVLSGSFRLNEDMAKILLATLLEMPEVKEVDFASAEEFEKETAESVVDGRTAFETVYARPTEEVVPVVQLKQCPNCRHDFERCGNGFYELAQTTSGINSAKQVIQKVEMDFGESCGHVDLKGKCMQCTEETLQSCFHCDEELVLVKMVKCKDFENCDHAYCAECAKTQMTEGGYCDDCGNVSCSGCDEDVEQGAQKKCANPDCTFKPDYCAKCALALLNKKGWCSTCSEEEVQACDGDCGEEFTQSLLIECKNFDDCGHSYCEEDAKTALNELGYCDDCEVVDCDAANCSNEVKRGEHRTCKNPDCEQNWVFCEDDAKRYLNKKGQCSSCSGEAECTCDGDCGEEYTESLLKKCKNYDTCEKEYCPTDAKTELSKRGLCPDCEEERAATA